MTCDNRPGVIELRQGTTGQPINIEIGSPRELVERGVTGMSPSFIEQTWGPGAAEKFRKARNKDTSDTKTLTELAKTAETVGNWESRPIHSCTPIEYNGKRAIDGWPISLGYTKPVIPY